MQNYTKFQKTLSFTLIFSILFTFTVNLSFFSFLGQVFASDSQSYNLVSIYVQEDVYSGVKSKVNRYARDIAGVLQNTKTMIIPVPSSATPYDIVKFNERLYTSGYDGIDGLSGDAKLVGSVFVGNIPLPVVQNAQATSKTVFPYLDFVDKLYIYDETSKVFSLNSDIISEPKAEIWHGFISPNSGDTNTDENKINDYFDKNHDYYIGEGNFKKENNITNGVEDEELSDTYEPYVFYYDQVREYNALVYSNYKSYKAGMGVIEDLAYNRFSKTLTNYLKAQYNSSQSSSLSSLSTIFGSSLDLSDIGSTADSSKIPDIQLSSLINNYTKKFIQVFNGDTIGKFRKFVYNAGRYNKTGNDVNVDLVPTIVTDLDVFSQSILKNVNTDLEKEVDGVVKNGLSRNIALPTTYSNYDGSCVTSSYTNFLNGKQSSTITSAAECSLYRGSMTNSGNLVETNRGYAVSNIENDINLCQDKTTGYWGGNTSINLDMDKAAEQEYSLKDADTTIAITPIFDITGTKKSTDETLVLSPVNCLEPNYILNNSKKWVNNGGSDGTQTCETTFNMPINGTSADNWSCSTTNTKSNDKKTFDEIFGSFYGKTSNSSCQIDSIKLGTKVVKQLSSSCGTDGSGNTIPPEVNTYSYKSIPSYLAHKSPTSDELSAQTKAMITQALPVDTDRYVDFISASNVYQKYYYPYLFRLKLDETKTIDLDNAKSVLKTYLDQKSLELNKIIQTSDPSKLTGAQKEIYDLLKTGSYPDNTIDLYDILSQKSSKEVELYGEKKTITYIDSLAFAIYWNNLSSVSSKYKFVFENYLSDQYKNSKFSYFLPKNKQSYEMAYIGAPGDSQNMYIKMDPEQKGENPFADILTQNQTLDNSLLNLNTNTSTSSATNKCSPPEGVPIWEWIPAVTCRIKDMLPPKISVSDGSCGSSLASFMGYGYLDENKDGINDYLQTDLNGGDLLLESDSKKYYYNKSGVLEASLVNKDLEVLTLDNASDIDFELVKVDSLNGNNQKEAIYDKDYPVSDTQDTDAQKYVSFKNLTVRVTNGKAKYIFSTKALDADLTFRAVLNLKDYEGNTVIQKEKYLTVQVRGDLVYMGTSKLYNDGQKLVIDSSLNSVTASDKNNIYLVEQDNFNLLKSNLESLNSNSSSKDKIFLTLVNKDKKGNNLNIDYPLTLKVVDTKSNVVLNKKIQNIAGLLALGNFKSTGKYTFTIKDANGYVVEKTIQVLPDTATKIVPELSTNLMESNGVITTNVFSIYDQFDNPASAQTYNVEVSIDGSSLTFEDKTKTKTFSVFDAYKPFRLKSTSNTGKSNITFVLKKDKTEIQRVTKTVNVVDKINFDVTGDFDNVKVGNKNYDYQINVKQVGDSNFSARAYLVSNKVYYTSSNDFFDIKNNSGSGSFTTKTKAGESVKLEFKVEGVKDSVYKDIKIYPDLAIKVDLTLSKSKLEASTGSTSTLTAALKDRYGNIVWNDNSTKLNYLVHSNYKNVITPTASNQTAVAGKTTFILRATNIPGTAFFKVSTTPDLSQNVVTINSSNYFTKSDVKSLGLYENNGLSEVGKKLFKVITDNDYKFIYDTYADFEKSLDFGLLTTSQKIYVKKFFDNIKSVNISGVGANVGKIETFYYWSKDKIQDNSYNSIYTTLLGASYGDITVKDNLASSMIFDKENRSLAVTSLLNDVQKRTEILTVSPNGNLLLNNNSSNLSQDVQTYFGVDAEKDFNLTFVNETLDEIVSKVTYNFNNDNLILSRCLDANTNNCFDKMKSSIVLKATKSGYKTELSNGTLKIYDNSSSNLLEIDANGKIVNKSSYLSFEINKNYTNALVLNLKINGEVIGSMGVSLKYSQINFIRDTKLTSGVKTSQKQGGIIVYLEEKNYSYTKQFAGNSTNSTLGYNVYYNDVLSSNKPALNKFSDYFEYGYENFYSQEGIGWEGLNKTLLLVSAGESVGEATKKYQTFSMINIGDPVVTLKQTKKKLGTTTKTRNFDSTIGKAISLDKDNIAYNVLDFNKDGTQDIVVLKTNGNIKLLTGRGLGEFNDEGIIANISDLSNKAVIETGDFNGDGYDDIMLLSDKSRPILLANINKKLYRYNLKNEISLKGTISQIVAYDLDLDGKSDLVTLDDSGEINAFYGTSETAKFSKKFISGGHGIKLSSNTRTDNGLVYYEGIYQLPNSGSNEYLTTSNELYETIQQNVKNLESGGSGTTLNENLINNTIFRQINYATGTSIYDSSISDLKQNIIKAIPTSTSSDLSSSLNTTKQDVEYLTNTYLEKYNSGNIIYNNTNTQANTTFLKSEYSSYDGLKVEKNYVNLTNTTSDILRGGDKIRLTIKLTNTTTSLKNKVVYLDKVPTPFKLSSTPNFTLNVDGYSYTGSNLPIKNSPSSDYNFLLDSYIEGTKLQTLSIYPNETITLNVDLDTNYFTYGYITAGDFNKDNKEGDIIFKPDYRSCGSTYDMYKSQGNREYKSSEEELTCSEDLPESVSENSVDDDKNGVPDYIDKIIDGTDSEKQTYASGALSDLYTDTDGDGVPDNQDISPNFDGGEDFMTNLDKLNETTDQILTGIDIITQGLGCGFGGGSCISSPLNWAPLAPGSDPTLFGSPIGDGLKVNEGIPVFSMMNYTAIPSPPFCIPMPWPPGAMSPGCSSLGAGGSLMSLSSPNPTNYLRIFVTPTITGAVGTAICFGQPSVAGYSNPPGVHPLVTGGNCIVAAAPVVGCKNDGSDGSVYNNIVPTISGDDYNVYNGNCDTKETSNSLYLGSLASDYLSYKKTGKIDEKSFNEKLQDLVADTSDNTTGSLPEGPLVNLGDGTDASNLDVDLGALKEGNFSDVVKVSMQRVSAFPDFIMNWVTRQLEEIATKLTDFPTIFLVLPDFSGITDISLSNIFENIKSSYDTGTKTADADKAQYQAQIDSLKSQKNSINCDSDPITCKTIDIQIDDLTREKEFGSSQTLSGIRGAYEFMSTLPIVNIQPQKVFVDIPWVDASVSDRAVLDWQLTSKQWKEEIESAKQRWNIDQYECIENPSYNSGCKVILDSQNLIDSLDQNIEILESYKKLPEQLHEMLQIKEIRLEQILCNVEAISKIMAGWISENGQIFKTWVELYVLIKAILKSWQLLADVFIDYQEECYQCKNERQDLMYYIWKLISAAIPTMPVIQFPKWPDIYIDLHNIRAGLTIYMPDFEFNLRPIILPTLPNLYLPDAPNVNISLPSLPVLPSVTLPTLPELPGLPSVQLPNLPPAPTLPKLFSSIEGYLNILKVITKVMCILKTSPFVPEWRAGDQIAFITERSSFSPMDFIDLSFPQFSLPFVDAIKITSYVNLEFQTDFLVQMAEQAVLPLNVFSNDIANLLDISLGDIDLSGVTPSDVNIDLNTNGSVDNNINDSLQNGINGGQNVIDNATNNVDNAVNGVNNSIENVKDLKDNIDSYKSDSKSKQTITLWQFTKVLALNIAKVHDVIQKDSKVNLTNKEFKAEISKQLASKTLTSDLKAQGLTTLWNQTLNYSFSKENALINDLLKNNENKFKTLADIINLEKQKNNKLITTLDKKLNSKPSNILISTSIKDDSISTYNKQLQVYNQKTVDSLKKVYGEDTDVKEIKADAKDIVSQVTTGLSNYTKGLQENISKTNSTVSKDLLSYVNNSTSNDEKKNLVALTTTSTTSTTTKSTSSCKTSGYGYNYKGLYIVETDLGKKLSYRLFDFIDELTGKEIIKEKDMDNDGDSDAIYMVGNEIFYKQNITSKPKATHYDGSPIVVDNFVDENTNLPAINGVKQGEVTSGSFNLNFLSPTNKATKNFNIELYDVYDKFNDVLNHYDSTYTPTKVKKVVVDAFVDTDNSTINTENSQTGAIFRNNLGTIDTVGNLAGVTLTTNEVKNVKTDLENKLLVLINAKTKLYAGSSSVKIDYYLYKDNSKTIKTIRLPAYQNISFPQDVVLTSLNDNLYITTDNKVTLKGNEIISYAKLPLSLDSSLEYTGDESSYSQAIPFVKLKYYDGTTRDLDFREVRYYYLKDLGLLSNDYSVNAVVDNGNYYATIRAFSNGIYSNYSDKISINPQKESDKKAPEISKFNIEVPVYEKKSIDITDYINEDSGFSSIMDVYVDEDLSKDSSGDGIAYNDIDYSLETKSNNFLIKKIAGKIIVDVGPFESLVKKKIRIFVIDANENLGYKDINFEVFSVKPKISDISNNKITGSVEGNSKDKPISFYRIRGGAIQKLFNTNGSATTKTDDNGNYTFALEPSIKGLELKYTVDGKTYSYAKIDEDTGKIDISDSTKISAGLDVKVLPSNSVNNSEAYPKITITKNGQIIYYEYLVSPNVGQVDIEDDFANVKNVGVHYLPLDKTNYGYFSMPLTLSKNPGDMFIYETNDAKKTPIVTIFKDGRINVTNSNYSIEYSTYGNYVVYNVKNSSNQIIGKVMIVPESSYILK